MAIRNENITGATTNWEDGEVLFSNDLLDTTNGMLNAGVPLGSVTAWLKSFDNTPSLPTNWVECNGQVLSDAESVYNGKTIPNLNGAVDTGLKGYFLRGHTSSGLTESSQNLAHTHTIPGEKGSGSRDSIGRASTSTYIENTTGSSGGTEARPHNYSVVWIMRIK